MRAACRWFNRNRVPFLPPVYSVREWHARPPGDRDRGWHVEGKIRWKVFARTGGRPSPGSVWFFALCRYDYGPDGTKPVTLSSTPLTVPSFHHDEDYGRLSFERPKR